MSEKKMMLGNAAIARGVWEAGCKVSSAYPGTPSTEISEELVKYPEVYAEWAPNEKVAAEVAIGASRTECGGRSAVFLLLYRMQRRNGSCCGRRPRSVQLPE